MLYTTAFLAMAFTTLCFIYKFVSDLLFYWDRRLLPCVSLKRNLINSLNTALNRKPMTELIDDAYRQKKDERICGMVTLFAPVLLVCDPELASLILVKDFAHFEDRNKPVEEEDSLIASLPQANGKHWRYLRHKLTPIFTSSKLRLMVGQISGCCDNAIQGVQAWRGRNSTVSSSFLNKYTLSVIGSVAFGLHFDMVAGCPILKKEFIERTQRFFKPSFMKWVKILLRFNFPKVAKRLNLKLIDEDTERFFTNLVRDTISHRERTGEKRNDFIQLMMELRDRETEALDGVKASSGERTLRKKTSSQEDDSPEADGPFERCDASLDEEDEIPDRVFTESCIVANSFNFISNGTETTASLLEYSMYYIASDSGIQDKLRTEIEAVLAENPLDYNALKQLTFMDQFIYEVLRMHPPNGVLPRVCKKDYPIPGSDRVIRRGEVVIIPFASYQMDPEYFPNPQEFDPRRFKNMQDIPKGVYLPFGDGPRMCIAVRLVMIKVKVFLCKFLMGFNVSLNDQTELPLKPSTTSYINTPSGGIWLDYQERV